MSEEKISASSTTKATRLLDYLLRLASLRTRTIREVSKYEKVFWVSDVPHLPGCFTQAWGRDEEHDVDEWLEVQNRDEPELPAVPEECKEWVEADKLRIKDDIPSLKQEIIRQVPNPEWTEGSDQPELIPQKERLDERPDVQQLWDTYVEHKWMPWMENHNAWEPLYKAYSALFAIYQQQLRLGEEFELVLGLGLLSWQTPTGQKVRRHLLVANASLEFEARSGKFTLRPHAEGASLRPELDMLDVEEQPTRAEEIAKSSLTAADDNPWDKNHTQAVMEALVHSIDPHGQFSDCIKSDITTSKKPVVEYAPALILRKRSERGLTETLTKIKGQVDQGVSIPGGFADLAECEPSNDPPLPTPGPGGAAPLPEEVFFPKVSNDEQRRIIDKMQSAEGVLVQGPPGTGKSHTIANLISHLLATGKRTLITAKTPRALQVLEDLMPYTLRPLCINLLGSGVEERRSLESSVGGILQTSQLWNENDAENKRKELQEQLRTLREEHAVINRRLRAIRESETHDQTIAGGAYRGTAARIAEAINRVASQYDFFTDDVPLEGTCPLEVDKLRSLRNALGFFTVDKRNELNQKWPEQPLAPEVFSELVEKYTAAKNSEEQAIQGADERLATSLSQYAPSTVESLRATLTEFRQKYRKIQSMPEPWLAGALRDILGNSSTMWRELIKVPD